MFKLGFIAGRDGSKVRSLTRNRIVTFLAAPDVPRSTFSLRKTPVSDGRARPRCNPIERMSSS